MRLRFCQHVYFRNPSNPPYRCCVQYWSFSERIIGVVPAAAAATRTNNVDISSGVRTLGPLHTNHISSYENTIAQYLKLHVYK